MAIVVRSVSSTASGGSPRVITKPSGVVTGDTLILQVGLSTNVAPTALPVGFVLIPGSEITGSNNIRLYAKTAGGAEPADYTVTYSGNGTLGMMVLYSDTGAALVTDGVGNQTNASSGNREFPSVTTTVANTILACFAALGSSNSSTPDAAMTERYDAGSAPRIYLMTQAIAAAGATGTRTATATTIGSTTTSKCVSVAWGEVGAPTPPVAPSGLTATAVSTSQIDLMYSDNSSNEDDFDLEQSADGLTGWALIANPLANATSHSVTGLTDAATYYFRIRASNGGGDSAWSNVASATTDSEAVNAPTGLTATAISSSQIDLTWVDESNFETGYEVQRSPNGSTGWGLIATTAASAQSYSDTGLTDGTAYHYRVRGVNATEQSAYTSVATDTTPLIAPTGLTATGASASSISLSWTDASSAETGYKVEQSSDGVSGWVVIYTTGANTTEHLVTGLPENTEFYFRVRAFENLTPTLYSAYTSTASALTLLLGHAPIEPRLYLHSPSVVFAARTNYPFAAEYPIESVVYDTVTTGSFGAIRPGMTVMLGTTVGGDQLGRQRVRSVNGAGADGIAVRVGRSSQGTHDGELTLTDNAYITVLDDRRLWAKIPYIDPRGDIFKDSSMDVGDYTTTPPPVANCGAGFAATIDATTSLIQVLFNGQSSFAVADGATITTYAWNIKDGTLTSGTLASNNITATFPAGFRYVELTVTDSNGNSHTAVCPVYGRDPANDTSFDEFKIDSHRVAAAGQTMSISILADMPRATYFDGCLAMIWEREPSGTADRDHMLLNGWLDTENATISAGRTGLVRDTTLTILDVAARLDMLPGFPQSLADDATRDVALIPDITWNYMVNPNLDKYLHYLLHWHSTALDVADFTWSGAGADYPFVLLNSDGQSLWNQVDQRARAFVPDYVLTCDRRGRIAVVPDPQLRDIADRTSVILAAIDENEWSDLRLTYQRSPRIHWLDGNAILAGSTTPIGTVFSIAPGEAPGQGLGATVQGEKLALSQATLNSATGHRYARINAPVTALTVTLVQDDNAPGSFVPWREIEPAYKQWVTLTMSAETSAQRGLTFTDARCLPKELNIRYNQTRTGLTRTIELTLEPETVGEPGVTVVKPNVPAVGVQPEVPPAPLVTTPPSMGLISGQQIVAGIGEGALYRTSDFQTVSGSGGPTWAAVALTVDSAILSWVVDPFSPGYIAGVGAINGWVATANSLYRVADIFGTVSCVSIHTFAYAATWRSIQASFGAYFAAGINPWLLCISYYGSTSGHTGTWALRSVDGGATFATETVVSEFYDSALASVNPIGVYTSPKTPGRAYTAAYIATDAPATTDGYVSDDWGATWERTGLFVDDPLFPLPMWAKIDNDGGNFALLGLSGTADFDSVAIATNQSDNIIQNRHLMLAPPKTAKRIEVEGNWEAVKRRVGAISSAAVSLQIQKPSTIDMAHDFVFASPAYGSTTTGVFSGTFTFLGGDWPLNTESILSAPPSAPDGVRFNPYAGALSHFVGHSAYARANISVTVTEIELDDGTIYTPPTAVGAIVPVQGQAGSIHLPWPDNASENIFYYGTLTRNTNREIRLKRAIGLDIVDISPTVSGVKYGVNAYGFAVRAFDNDRQYMAFGGIGNDTTASAANDQVALFVSSNAGAAWTNILAPVAASNALRGLSIAFAGDSSSVLYAWGGWTGSSLEPIYYSADGGTTLDSREGNLGSFGTIAFLGLAGGPST